MAEMEDRTARFRRLFDATYQPLHAYVRRRADAADADDLVADVLTVAWRRLDAIPAGAELPWLYGVARRTLANHRRGHARRRRLTTRLAALAGNGGPDDHDDGAVLAALARLSAADRELLRLAAWEDLDAADIAVALGCSVNAAALRLSRARRKLRIRLTEVEPTRTQAARKVTDA